MNHEPPLADPRDTAGWTSGTCGHTRNPHSDPNPAHIPVLDDPADILGLARRIGPPTPVQLRQIRDALHNLQTHEQDTP